MPPTPPPDRDTELTLAVYRLRRAGLIGLPQAGRILTMILDGAVPFPHGDAPLDDRGATGHNLED